MGWLITHANVAVAFVGLEAETTRKLRSHLLKTGVDDPGSVEIHPVKTTEECRAILDTQKITSICIRLEAFTAQECIGFIADVRITHPLVAFCLVGTKQHLKDMPDYHPAWRERFKHYFKLSTDVGDDDFTANALVLRDLLVADVVKTQALGQYQTTPGALIRLKAASPYGFWITLVALLITAIIGGAVGPLMDRFFPAKEKQGTHAPGTTAAASGNGAASSGN
ncbi:MAG TPA: hypothetical protein VGN07_10255 [Steroidobacteraceae bacterium]|jgi:hypothetical protein